MDPNNSGFIVEDELNESDFTAVSSIGAMDMKQMAEKIQKLEDLVKKNAMGTSNVDQSGMMQIVWQMGEKYGKLNNAIMVIGKENGEMKDGMCKMMKEFEELKKANDGLKEEVGKLVEENGKLKEENAEKREKMEEMKKEIEGLKLQRAKAEETHAFEELKEENKRKMWKMAELIEKNGEKNAELERKIVENNDKLKAAFKEIRNEIGDKNAELDDQIAGLKEEEEKLKEMMRELQEKIEEMTKLTEQIGGIEWVKYDWKAFKFNEVKCGTKLTISEGGLFAKHSVPNYIWNSIRTNLPIPTFNNLRNINNKPTFAFYFETEIFKPNGGIVIGFCGQEFPLEGKWLGNEKNSIGICNKGGIWIDGYSKNFETNVVSFKNGDVIGIGLIQKPNFIIDCFATWNGQLLGKIEMPPKFASFQLYPAANLYYTGESVRVNFDKENCQFKDFGQLLQ